MEDRVYKVLITLGSMAELFEFSVQVTSVYNLDADILVCLFQGKHGTQSKPVNNL